MNKERIVDYLCRNICGKKILYVPDLTWVHTPKYIITHDWQSALHEIAHWIVCDPSQRIVYNLGLPEVDTEIPPHLYYRMYSEECRAMIVNKLLIDKYIKQDDDKGDWGSYELIEMSKLCANKINKDYIELYNNSLELCNHYTKSIIIIGDLICKIKII